MYELKLKIDINKDELRNAIFRNICRFVYSRDGFRSNKSCQVCVYKSLICIHMYVQNAEFMIRN